MKRDEGQASLFRGPPLRGLGREADKGTGGEVANALVCKTSIHGFNSHPVLQQNKWLIAIFLSQNNTMITILR